ncbi:MAG: HAMP domain-containing histidine kinase [candidate division Zixibacteria bacterium]|nr:HAMP domain-containing histidine kinase [candidate division Zixibacteria bacterium]
MNHCIHRIAIGIAIVLGTLAVPGMTTGAADRLDVESDADTSFLPYRAVVERHFQAGPCRHEARVRAALLGHSPSDSGACQLILAHWPMIGSNGPATFDLTSYPPFTLVQQKAVLMRICDWLIVTDSAGGGTQTILGARHRDDTAWVFRLDPYTMEYDELFLMTGEDGDRDGKWTPEIYLPMVADIDADGCLEAFVYVNRVREKGFRTLFCVDWMSFTVRWTLPVAVGIRTEGMFDLRDSTHPGVMFLAHGSNQGAQDEDYRDRYSYLSIVDADGTLRYNAVVSLEAEGQRLIAAEKDGLYYLSHDLDPTPHDTVIRYDSLGLLDDLKNGGHRISRLDRTGRILQSRRVSFPVLYLWLMPYRDLGVALWVKHQDRCLRVYDTTLTLVAESNPTSIAEYYGRIDIPGHQNALLFSNGIYREDMSMLATFEKASLRPEPMMLDHDGNLSHIMAVGSAEMSIVRIEQRNFWDRLGSVYIRYKVYVLMLLSGLVVGLILVNLYRRRTKHNLVLIARQKEELQAAKVALEAAQAQIVAQEKYELARDIAGGFAHEIRNALSPARHCLARLQAIDPADLTRDNQTRLAGLIDSALDRAVNLTRVIAEYSSLEDLKVSEQVDIAGIVGDVLRAFEPTLETGGIAVAIDLPANTFVQGNRAQYAMVFTNLVTNAIDALEGVDDPKLDVSCCGRADEIEVTVRDNGCGIADEHRDRIFDFFYSTKPSTGSGVGLALVRKIITMYGGAIDVESEAGKGTTFRLHFPR